ncbi:hypothetical protein [Streptomyces sp. NPDC058385]|uniref:hypothetical protein n=1 Tax=Streptomyces sp. NPDC058385 TaxID=3346473 RepID=UPI003668BFDE
MILLDAVQGLADEGVGQAAGDSHVPSALSCPSRGLAGWDGHVELRRPPAVETAARVPDR